MNTEYRIQKTTADRTNKAKGPELAENRSAARLSLKKQSQFAGGESDVTSTMTMLYGDLGG
jgi:hypothetical protein